MLRAEFNPSDPMNIDFEAVIVDEDSFELFIDRHLSFKFENLAIVDADEIVLTSLSKILTKDKSFGIGEAMLKRRIIQARNFEEDRIQAFFGRFKKPMFFNSEEASLMAGFFEQTHIIADAEIHFNGKPVELKGLPLANQLLIVAAMESIGLYNMQEPAEYMRQAQIKRYRKLTTKKDYRKEVRVMKKMTLYKNIGLGALALATGGALAIAGGLVVGKNLSDLLGLTKEVILIEN